MDSKSGDNGFAKFARKINHGLNGNFSLLSKSNGNNRL